MATQNQKLTTEEEGVSHVQNKWQTLGKSSDVSHDREIDDLMHPPPSTRPRYRKWTIEEEKTLCDGVKKHGSSNWLAILNDSQFAFTLANRSNIKLKLKFPPLSTSSDVSNNKKKVRARRSLKSQNYPVDEVSHSQDCPADEVSDFQDFPTDEVSDSQDCPVDEVSESDIYLIEELSNSQDHHHPCTITGQRTQLHGKPSEEDEV